MREYGGFEIDDEVEIDDKIGTILNLLPNGKIEVDFGLYTKVYNWQEVDYPGGE